MLENYSWKSARERFKKSPIALIPVGATEQHGPQLPLGTDFFAAEALAQAAAKETDTICTPVIPVGVSPHHRQFWGTLWVSQETFRRYMREIADSLVYHGIKRVIYVNGHGGNFAPLQEVCQQIRQGGQSYAVVWQWWTDAEIVELCAKLFKSKGTHAGAIETSMVWAVKPKLVDQSKFEEAARGASPVFGISKFGSQLPVDTLDFSETGATLDPREASPKAGKQLFEASTERLVNLVKWLETAKESELRPKAHKP